MPPQTDDEWEDYFQLWAQQTIMFAYCLKGHDIGREINPGADAAQIAAAFQESMRVASIELWDEAVTLCGGTYSESAGFTYVGLVMDWCAKHLGYQPLAVCAAK